MDVANLEGIYLLWDNFEVHGKCLEVTQKVV